MELLQFRDDTISLCTGIDNGAGPGFLAVCSAFGFRGIAAGFKRVEPAVGGDGPYRNMMDIVQGGIIPSGFLIF
jgi:hypothetical protein